MAKSENSTKEEKTLTKQELKEQKKQEKNWWKIEENRIL